MRLSQLSQLGRSTNRAAHSGRPACRKRASLVMACGVGRGSAEGWQGDTDTRWSAPVGCLCY